MRLPRGRIVGISRNHTRDTDMKVRIVFNKALTAYAWIATGRGLSVYGNTRAEAMSAWSAQLAHELANGGDWLT